MTETPRAVLAVWLMLLCLWASPVGATGPSGVSSELVPMAVRGDVFLFRTRWTLNAEGGLGIQRTEYGWLVVGPKGLWREVPHRVLEPTQGPRKTTAAMDPLDREFEQPLDWRSPPASLRPLLREFGFRETDAVSAQEGEGSVTWTPEHLCQGARCGAPCLQRSLHGLQSDTWRGRTVTASFVHGGLALFENQYLEYEAETARGAAFQPVRPLRGWPREGIEAQHVVGICWLPRGEPKTPPPPK
jgi:hypothetical protein